VSEDFDDVSISQYDAAVARTPGIAHFCSSSAWVLPAHRYLNGERELLARQREGHWLLMARGAFMQIPSALQPLDAQWCFCSPLIGGQVSSSVTLLTETLSEETVPSRLVLLGGIPRDEHWFHCLSGALTPMGTLRAFTGTDCLVASLADGTEGFLSRRSGKFRAELRRSERKAEREGVRFDHAHEEADAQSLLERILSVEQRSWKWQAGESIFQACGMLDFYRDLMRRTAAGGTLRAVFACRDGQDLGYAFGASFAGSFRGLQMGYDRACETLSLGNLCQWQLIQRLAGEGIARYDLGMDIDYKRRWAEERLELVTLLLVRG